MAKDPLDEIGTDPEMNRAFPRTSKRLREAAKDAKRTRDGADVVLASESAMRKQVRDWIESGGEGYALLVPPEDLAVMELALSRYGRHFQGEKARRAAEMARDLRTMVSAARGQGPQA